MHSFHKAKRRPALYRFYSLKNHTAIRAACQEPSNHHFHGTGAFPGGKPRKTEKKRKKGEKFPFSIYLHALMC